MAMHVGSAAETHQAYKMVIQLSYKVPINVAPGGLEQVHVGPIITCI